MRSFLPTDKVIRYAPLPAMTKVLLWLGVHVRVRIWIMGAVRLFLGWLLREGITLIRY